MPAPKKKKIADAGAAAKCGCGGHGADCICWVAKWGEKRSNVARGDSAGGILFCNLPEPAIRRITSADYDAVLAIESESFEFPWTRKDLSQFLNRKDESNVGFLCEINGEIVGYVLYSLSRTHIVLVTIAVAKKYRRTGIGKLLLEKVKSRILGARSRVRCLVRETNVNSCCFLRSQGFRASGLVQKCYDDTDEAGVAMTWRKEPSPEVGKNRVSKYFEMEGGE